MRAEDLTSSSGAHASQPDLQIGDLRVDMGRARVSRDGQPLPLPRLSFDLLVTLARAAPNLLTVDELMDRVWPGLVVEPDTVSQRIKLLRQALGDDSHEPRYIAGVRGRGYQMIASVSVVAPIADMPPTVIGAPKSRLWLPGAALLLLLLAGSMIWWWSRGPATATPAVVTETMREQLPAPVALRTAVAVLPFANDTGDPDKEYLGDGLADELINMLHSLPGLTVPARTSTFAYKGRGASIQQIARDLSVGSIVEGNVRAAGKRLRVSARLINAQDGNTLWNQNYDEEFTDIFKLQDKLAKQIATTLQVRLAGGAEPVIPQSAGTTDVEGYNLYLQGMSMIPGTMEQSTRALDLFQQAIQRDPRYARAWSGMGLAHAFRSRVLRSDAEALESERAARQALAMDPHDNDALLLLCGISQLRNFLESDSYCRTAVASAPADANAHGTYVAVLANVGHLREALAEARKSYALAPANGGVVTSLVQALSMNGLDTEAARWASIARAMTGPTTRLTSLRQVEFRLALRERRLEAATDALAMVARGAIDRTSLALIVAAMADPAQRPAAMAVKSRFYPKVSAPKPGGQVSQQWLTDSAATCTAAYAYATAGMLDEAFDLANRCLPAPLGIAVASMWAPESAAFRRDSRFAGYVDRFGRNLFDYWQKYGPPDDCDLKDGKLTCH